MRIDDPAVDDVRKTFVRLGARAKASGPLEWVRYLDLGTHVVKLVNYSKGFTPHVEKQLSYVLRDDAKKFDVTLVIWQELDFETFAMDIWHKHKNLLLTRVKRLALKDKDLQIDGDKHLQLFDNKYSKWHPIVDVNPWGKVVSAHDVENKTYYYSVADLRPEEFIKHGHIFVQTFNKILKTTTTALAHGAAVALNGKGVLLCARGQRGKSTLAVKAMMDGFDYISDDYLVLEKKEDGLYAYPIYSIITLAPKMYGDLYDAFNGKFVSNNARKDKYVFNIDNYHNRFKSSCKINMCMIPQITQNDEPMVLECNIIGKGRAVTQLIHSTINQMGDQHDIQTVRKFLQFVQDKPFYQINLCRDIIKNNSCLKKFLYDGVCGEQTPKTFILRSNAAEHDVFGFT
jgi:hypothetical protein